MLSSSNREEKELMMNYYRTSDMLNLLLYFPELSPIRDLTISKARAWLTSSGSITEQACPFSFLVNFICQEF